MSDDRPPRAGPKGRGAHINPPNRFESTWCEADDEHLIYDDDYWEQQGKPRTEYLDDDSASIVAENNSPDIPFRYSVNPYRGCQHGCAYCYARPTHQYLGYSAGLDFETKVLVKHRAPQLLKAFLARPSWSPEVIAFSGVTDCYQPAERTYRLTRQCLEVTESFRQPIGIVTKNALVTRDLDLLGPMAAANLVRVGISITTLDAELARSLEPRTSTPAARLKAIAALSRAGVPVRAMVAPIIPGLNDQEIPAILAAVAAAGAKSASYVMLRLPLEVKPVFLEWLDRAAPIQRDRILSLIRNIRGGELNSAEFGQRMRGRGQIADQIQQLFAVCVRKHGLDQPVPPIDVTQFRVPEERNGQKRLF